MNARKTGVFIGIIALALYGFAMSPWAAETLVSPHQLTADDQKIVDALVRMSGKDSDTVLRLYETGKGWGDVAENLGLEMEDVLKEVNRFDKSGQKTENKRPPAGGGR